MDQKPLTYKEMDLISHALGVRYFESFMSHKKRDKILPETFYRNYFNANYDHVFEELCNRGFANKAVHFTNNYYHLTVEGINKFRQQLQAEVVYIEPENRGIGYLKNRINFYCSFYDFKYCADNSDHILNCYVNYTLRKFKVSQTTAQVINYFKSELKKAYNAGLLAKWVPGA